MSCCTCCCNWPTESFLQSPGGGGGAVGDSCRCGMPPGTGPPPSPPAPFPLDFQFVPVISLFKILILEHVFSLRSPRTLWLFHSFLGLEQKHRGEYYSRMFGLVDVQERECTYVHDDTIIIHTVGFCSLEFSPVFIQGKRIWSPVVLCMCVRDERKGDTKSVWTHSEHWAYSEHRERVRV